MQKVYRPGRSIVPICRGLAFAFATLVLSPAIAQDSSRVDPATIESGHPTGHLHDHRNDTWPPQSRGIHGAVNLSNPGTATAAFQAQRQRADLAERRAMVRPDVREALGDRYTRATLIEADPKTGSANVSQLVYFSLSRNETVTVTLDRQRVRSVTTTPAAEYQPEITEEETAEAAEIARAYFLNHGKGRISTLQAFGILAYKPTGKGFYDQRVLYLSFHEDNDSPPEFVAWVDLSAQQVLRAREER